MPWTDWWRTRQAGRLRPAMQSPGSRLGT
jgi:hypothetical protein